MSSLAIHQLLTLYHAPPDRVGPRPRTSRPGSVTTAGPQPRQLDDLPGAPEAGSY
ncbi:hypothetical protein [Nocardia sp. NPDC003963]